MKHLTFIKVFVFPIVLFFGTLNVSASEIIGTLSSGGETSQNDVIPNTQTTPTVSNSLGGSVSAGGSVDQRGVALESNISNNSMFQSSEAIGNYAFSMPTDQGMTNGGELGANVSNAPFNIPGSLWIASFLLVIAFMYYAFKSNTSNPVERGLSLNQRFRR